jgi:23S rRNA pseudouridine1911/1915/1917 synthase
VKNIDSAHLETAHFTRFRRWVSNPNPPLTPGASRYPFGTLENIIKTHDEDSPGSDRRAADCGTDRCFFDPRWPVFFEDNHLLAVYKPSGLLVQGDHTGDICLLDLSKRWLKVRYQKPGKVFLAMVHRLDRPVAGVVLFARTSKAAGRLAAQFRERTVEKRYLAVVSGVVPGESGRLINQIERINRVSRLVPAPSAASREARLRFTVLGRDREKSLLRVALETGRRHQIRLQLAHMGHPILGDLRYGADRPLPERQIALLAQVLIIDHPVRGERLVIRCPLPRGWPWPDREAPENRRPPWDWHALAAIFQKIDPASGALAQSARDNR